MKFLQAPLSFWKQTSHTNQCKRHVLNLFSTVRKKGLVFWFLNPLKPLKCHLITTCWSSDPAFAQHRSLRLLPKLFLQSLMFLVSWHQNTGLLFHWCTKCRKGYHNHRQHGTSTYTLCNIPWKEYINNIKSWADCPSEKELLLNDCDFLSGVVMADIRKKEQGLLTC